jgi:hypothetical protein
MPARTRVVTHPQMRTQTQAQIFGHVGPGRRPPATPDPFRAPPYRSLGLSLLALAARVIEETVAGDAWLVLAPVFKAGGACREAMSGGFDSHGPPPLFADSIGPSMSVARYRFQWNEYRHSCAQAHRNRRPFFPRSRPPFL